MATRKIKTNLLSKQEAFKVIALGEMMKLPILLIGKPGTGKTAIVSDYSDASPTASNPDNLFILETDEGTKSTAVKGNIDLKLLTTKQEFAIDSPISRANTVIINEIDKASPSLRNSLLSIMNERVIFNGEKKIPCKWGTFVATCNEIPEDEKDSPFWDRFLITHEVKRISESQMMNYFEKGGKQFSQENKVNFPSIAELKAIDLDMKKLSKLLSIARPNLSDRALSFMPRMIKAVMGIWKLSQSRAMVKTAELLMDKPTAKTLAEQLVSKEVSAIYNAIDAVGQADSTAEYNRRYDEVQKAFKHAEDMGALDDADREELSQRFDEEQAKLDFLSDEKDADTWANL